MMGKPHPVELRQRMVDHVAEANTHRAMAARFKVSVRFVNDMVNLKAATGGLVPKAAQTLRDIGCWFLPLPPHSPDLNPIETAFAKRKAILRKAAARTYDDLWKAVGTVCDLFSQDECLNSFIAAGFEPDWE